MDFSNRNAHSQAAAPGVPSVPGVSRKSSSSDNGKWGRIGIVAAITAVVVILVALTLLAASGGGYKEDKYVDNTKLQAVFLNTGQVYFGNVKTLNNKYLVLSNIYYLQTSGGSGTAATQASTNSNVTLVKLGCELHEPLDQMVVNRDQITFWENLGDNGQVAKAVANFKKQNPNGQKCADQSSSSSTNSGSNVQKAGGTTTPTTTTPVKP